MSSIKGHKTGKIRIKLCLQPFLFSDTDCIGIEKLRNCIPEIHYVTDVRVFTKDIDVVYVFSIFTIPCFVDPLRFKDIVQNKI